MTNIQGVEVTFKSGVSFLGKNPRNYKYLTKDKKVKNVRFITTNRYCINVQGTKYKYYSDKTYRDTVITIAELCKLEWDREFYCPDSKINKIV